jgi:hypothetical protein
MRRDMRILSLAGGVLAVVIAAVALILLPADKNSLAEAAGKLDGLSLRAEMRMKVAGQFSMEGPIVSSARGTRARWDAHAVYAAENGELDFDILIVGQDSWFRYEQAAFAMPAGKRWVLSADDSEAGGMTMGEVASFLRDADDVERKGETTIRGMRVTYYAGRANARDAAERSGPEKWERWKRKFGDGDIMVNVEAWIDEDGLPRRLAVDYRAVSIRVDVLEYGVPVDIRAPSPGTTITEAEFDRVNPA